MSDSRSILGNKQPSKTSLLRINNLKHQIEKRELKVNRYQSAGYEDMSIFEELYFLHSELYELKMSLPKISPINSNKREQNLALSKIDAQTQIIDFIQTDSSFFLTRITSENIELVKLNQEKTIKAIENKQSVLTDQFKPAYSTYLDSVFVDLISKKHPKLIFIPDGDLFDFPIETIKDYSGKFLLNTYSISYASQISEAIEQKQSTVNDDLFAASYTSDATLKDRRAKSYPELYFAQNEIEQITKWYSNEETYLGYEFTEESITNGLNKDIIHISSHSSSSTDNPLDNFILVRDNEGNGIPVYGFTLKSMDWQTKLVILSSCESGTGTIKPGAGVFSLSRDFMQAGAQTVIKSLWKVNDRSTSELMVLFHQNLRKGESALQALQHAKIAVQSKASYSHPFYWAGFILEGNPNLTLSN